MPLLAKRPTIEFEECLKDSPKFREFLEEEEGLVDHLELKLEKTIKMCTIAVDSGKEYIKNQSAFATSLWELQAHFRDMKAQNALSQIIECIQEMNKFHTTLLDQASRTVLKNLKDYIRTDIRDVKEYKQLFTRVSESLDGALSRNANTNKNRPADVIESSNYLAAQTSCFRHTALDYVNHLTMLKSKKMPEILWTLLSYYQACSTFYHQGSDLCNDHEDFFKGLADDINDMRENSKQLEKSMQNRHASVGEFELENHRFRSEIATSDVSADSSRTAPQMEGYLFKRTSKGFKSWNRRWFYMAANQLLYKKRGHREPPSVMEEDLRICTVRPAYDSDRQFCFEVISPTKSHILQADSLEMLNTWMMALHKSIGAAIHGDKTCDDRKSSVTGANLTPLPSPGGQLKKIDWKQFLKIPGNANCCDCGHSEPRWASINLGITLCIACSGVHRSLGVHHSKVRSLTLDAWEPEIVKVMMELGNHVVNRVYEARVDDSVRRASERCDDAVREAWIRAKYVDRRFVRPIMMSSVGESLNDVAESVEVRKMEAGAAEIGGGGEERAALKVVRRWSVRRLRRRPNSKSRQVGAAADAVEQGLTAIDEDAKSSTSNVSAGSVLVIGGDFCDTVQLKEEMALSSDQESTGEEDDSVLDEEDITNLNPNLLLYKASAVHNIPVMCQALALGANKLWRNEADLKRTPLHQAILSGSSMACEYLLLNGIPIDVADETGYTALHLATEKGSTSQAFLLLKHRAKHDSIALNNKQPIDIAVEQANADIVTLLRLTALNEEIGLQEQGTGEGDTYNHVMRDFSVRLQNNRDTSNDNSQLPL